MSYTGGACDMYNPYNNSDTDSVYIDKPLLGDLVSYIEEE